MSIIAPHESSTSIDLVSSLYFLAVVGVVWFVFFAIAWAFLRKRVSLLKLAALTLIATLIFFVAWFILGTVLPQKYIPY